MSGDLYANPNIHGEKNRGALIYQAGKDRTLLSMPCPFFLDIDTTV